MRIPIQLFISMQNADPHLTSHNNAYPCLAGSPNWSVPSNRKKGHMLLDKDKRHMNLLQVSIGNILQLFNITKRDTAKN
jgi:hypothetical protein